MPGPSVFHVEPHLSSPEGRGYYRFKDTQPEDMRPRAVCPRSSLGPSHLWALAPEGIHSLIPGDGQFSVHRFSALTTEETKKSAKIEYED